MSDTPTKATDLLLLLVLLGPPKPSPAVPPSNANDSDPGHMLEPGDDGEEGEEGEKVDWMKFWNYQDTIEISRSRQLDAFAGQYDDPEDFEWTVQQQVRVIDEAIEQGMFDRFDGLDKVTMIGTLHNTTDVGAEHERVFDLDGNHLSLHIDFKGREAHPCHLYTDPRGPNRAVFDQYTDEYTTPREVMTRADKAKRDKERQERKEEEEDDERRRKEKRQREEKRDEERRQREREMEEDEERREKRRRREKEDERERRERERERERREDEERRERRRRKERERDEERRERKRDEGRGRKGGGVDLRDVVREELRREKAEKTRQEERRRLERERAEREEGEEKERRLRETLLRLKREREEREAREGAEKERRLREELLRQKAEREKNKPT